jgi:hypothetical protein
MSEIVIHHSSDHGKFVPFMDHSTQWLYEEMGFDPYMLKMIPRKHRWEECLLSQDNPSHCSVIDTISEALRPILWNGTLDEFYQETGCKHKREDCAIVLRQSGPGWVRWYMAFMNTAKDGVDYYIYLVFEDQYQAMVYRLSV